MDNGASPKEPAVRVVKLKSGSRSRKILFVVSLIILACFGLYFLKGSTFGSLLKRTSEKVFGVDERRAVEVVDLNAENSLNNASTVSSFETVVITDSEITDSETKASVNLYGVEIIDVIFDVDGPDEGNERIVLKNSSAAEVNLIGGSIQYLPTGREYSGIKKKNFEEGAKISPGSTFAIGANCHSSSPCVGVEMPWSESLGNDGGTVFVVSGRDIIIGANDASIVHRYNY